MSDRFKNIVFSVVAVVALSIIGIGLTQGDSSAPSSADRVDALSAVIKCPFCNGESLKESQSTVAAEYRALIAQRVADGATDDEVIAEFAANFGDGYILDTSTTNWSTALWIAPFVAIAIGVGAVLWMYRTARKRSSVAP